MKIGRLRLEPSMWDRYWHLDGSIAIGGNPSTVDEARDFLLALRPRYGPSFFSFRPFRNNEFEFGFSLVVFGRPLIFGIAKTKIICTNPRWIAGENVCKLGGPYTRDMQRGCMAHSHQVSTQ